MKIRWFEDGLVDVYRRAEKRLGEMQYVKTPVHDDIKADNAFVVGNDVLFFIDWYNLKLSDPMSDLAHFLWSIDAPVSSTKLFLSAY